PAVLRRVHLFYKLSKISVLLAYGVFIASIFTAGKNSAAAGAGLHHGVCHPAHSFRVQSFVKKKHAAFAFPSLRLGTAQFLLHVEKPALQAVILLPQPFDSLGGLLLFRGKLYGDLTVLIVYRLQVIHDSFSADHGDADALPEILHAQEFYRSDL